MTDAIKEFENIETQEKKNFSVDFQSGPLIHGINKLHFERISKLIRHKRRIFRETNVFFLKRTEEVVEKPIKSYVFGKALFKNKEIIINYTAPGPAAEETLFHELWHQVSKHKLKDHQRRCVYTELKVFGESWDYQYLDDPEERAARAFAAYASARAHGLGLSPASPGTAQEVFEAVYAGRVERLTEDDDQNHTASLPRLILVLPGLILGIFGLYEILT